MDFRTTQTGHETDQHFVRIVEFFVF